MGKSAVEFDFDYHQSKHSGWYKIFKGEEIWTESVNFVEQHWKSFSTKNIRFFVGNGEIFGDDQMCDIAIALPGIPVLDIIELVRTGTHNSPDDNWKFVKSELKKIWDVCPFDIQFADQAGLYAAFLKKPTKAQATKFSDIVCKISPEVFEGIHSIVEKAGFAVPESETWRGPDEEIAMIMLMTKIGKFRLWWD